MTDEENERDIDEALRLLQSKRKYDFGLVLTLTPDGHFGIKGAGKLEQGFQEQLQRVVFDAVHELLEARLGPAAVITAPRTTRH